jgi:hypothetical protein
VQDLCAAKSQALLEILIRLLPGRNVKAADRGNRLVVVLSIAAKKQQRFFSQNHKIEVPLGEAVSALC